MVNTNREIWVGVLYPGICKNGYTGYFARYYCKMDINFKVPNILPFP